MSNHLKERKKERKKDRSFIFLTQHSIQHGSWASDNRLNMVIEAVHYEYGVT
jgi:hypothetical protein